MGSKVVIAFAVRSQARRSQRVLVDFRVHFVKANGKSAPKVFKLKAADLELTAINTMGGVPVGGRSTHLIEVNDYISEKDTQLERVAEKFTGQNARCTSLGGYPLPPVFKAAKTESEAEKKTGT